MGALVRNCDTLRLRTGAHILVVHHSGKDEGRGARGHSLLRAATDTEIEVSKTDHYHVATVTKQRDHMTGEVFGFRLQPVEIGQDEAGVITSCVVVPSDTAPRNTAPTRRLSDRNKLALSVLTEVLLKSGQPAPALFQLPTSIQATTLEQWKDELFSRGVLDHSDKNPRQTFKRIQEVLAVHNHIGIQDGLVWVAR